MDSLSNDEIKLAISTYESAGVTRWVGALRELLAYREQQQGNKVTFDSLRDAVAEMTGGIPLEWQSSEKGHHAVPFINFNSLARIVDKFRAAPQIPAVPDEMTITMARAAHHGSKEMIVSYSDGWNACCAAMLAAAPKPGGDNG